MKYIIIANGTIKQHNNLKKIINTSDIIICANGGSIHLKIMNIIPDIVIGDCDSISYESMTYFKKHKVKFIKYPRDKNYSDTELAILWAIKNKASDITIIGATGTRIDHTLANILLMKKIAEKKLSCKIIDNNNEIYCVIDEIKLKGEIGDLISIIPITEKVTGITTKGLKYPLINNEMIMGSSLGISNSFVENQAYIKIKKGILIITKSID
ncbi:MAG: thiamine diphosphokinase [Desulfobacteraceae bacterium 4572_130]|nr:MAG: thiamine diphosphokinase [Desulfobacteraceae bacterium 4572_130]